MRTFTWKELLDMTEQEIWALDPGDNPMVTVKAADADVNILTRVLINNWYLWPFHRMGVQNKKGIEEPWYIRPPHIKPIDMPLEKRHFITTFRNSNKKMLSILTEGYRDYYKRNPVKLDVVKLNSMIARVMNHINNVFVMRIPEYVTSSTIKDYIEIMDEPFIKELKANLEPNQNSIRNGYDEATKYIMRADKFKHNQVAEYIKQGLVSNGQAMQCLIARGYLTDHNSRIFVKPILRSYGDGLGSFYDSFIESRSATKAYLFQKKPLEDSEWFNRKMQLVGQSVQHIHLGEDCGSTVTVPVVVRRGWLPMLAGKYYLLEDGTYGVVSEDDVHLENKVIQIRSAMYCNHPDRTGVCEHCYGQLAVSIPYFNVLSEVGKNEVIIGHISATEIGQMLSQKMLSTKHLDTSSTVDPFHVKRSDRLYIKPGLRDNAVRLNPRLKNEKVKMKVSFSKTTTLADITTAEDLDEVATRMSGFNEMILEFERAEGFIESIPIDTTQGSRQGRFTVDFLKFMQRVGWVNADKDYIMIDLADFDYECDVVELPLVHEDMMAYQKQIEGYIRFTGQSKSWRGKKITPDEAGRVLDEFFSLLHQRLNVNIVHAEVMLYAVMVCDPQSGDYRLPRAYEERELISYHECIEHRSLSVQLVYQEQAQLMLKQTTFLNDRRQPHPMDHLFVTD